MEESHRSIHDSLMIVKRCLKNREVQSRVADTRTRYVTYKTELHATYRVDGVSAGRMRVLYCRCRPSCQNYED